MKKELITILAVIAIIAGCAKEMEEFNGSSLKIGSVKTERMLTKSVIEGTSLPSAEAAKGIGLFLTASDGSAYDGKTGGYSNIKYSDSGSGWASSSPIMLSNTQGTLYGYFPYTSTVTDITAIPVSSSLNGTDYLYAATVTGLNKSSATASISMMHALARISVKFVKDASYTGTGTLTAFSISGAGIAMGGTLNAKTGAVTATVAAFSQTGLNKTLTTTGITEECLIVPAISSDSDQTINLTCIIDGKEYTTTFDSAANNGLIIKQGIQSNATIALKDKGLSITSVSTSAWGGGSGSTVEIDGGKKVTISQAADVIADDILANVRVEGQTVLINALSMTGKYLECTCADGCSIAQSKDATTGKYIFTVSSITKDIEVVLGYKKCNITVSYARGDATMGTYTINGASTSSITVIGGETVTLKATPSTGYLFIEWRNSSGERISDSNPFSFIAESDSTISLFLDDIGIVLQPSFVPIEGAKGIILDYQNGTTIAAASMKDLNGFTTVCLSPTYFYKEDDGLWYASPKVYYPLGKIDAWSFLALSGNGTPRPRWYDAREVEISLRDTSYILYAGGIATSKNSPVQLTFKHSQSFISVNVKLPTNENLEILNITVDNCYSGFEIRVWIDNIDLHSEYTCYDYNKGSATIQKYRLNTINGHFVPSEANADGIITFERFFPPQTLENATISVCYKSGAGEMKKITNIPDSVWNAGECYQYSIDLTAADL